MTDQNYTHITLVSDRSGSMERIRSDAEGGINALVADQKKEPGTCTFFMMQFDDRHETVYGPGLIAGMGTYKLVPRNNTAMLDAIGRAINTTGEYLSAMPEDIRPAHVVFAISTDGLENASQEFTYERIAEMVETQKTQFNWIFEFIAANQDAVMGANKLKIDNSTHFVANAASTRGVYASMSDNISGLRAGKGYAGGARSVDPDGKLWEKNLSDTADADAQQ